MRLVVASPPNLREQYAPRCAHTSGCTREAMVGWCTYLRVYQGGYAGCTPLYIPTREAMLGVHHCIYTHQGGYAGCTPPYIYHPGSYAGCTLPYIYHPGGYAGVYTSLYIPPGYAGCTPPCIYHPTHPWVHPVHTTVMTVLVSGACRV